MDNTAKYIRFTKDYNLPINLFNDEMFDYYRTLYKDFWPAIAEELMEKEIAECGSVDNWLVEYSKLRDKIIHTLEESDEYKDFNSRSLDEYTLHNKNFQERNIYTQETDGKTFLSIDLKKANFQALKYVGVIKDDTYEDFIKRMGGSDYFTNSKYLRQVIFGKLNPKKQMKVEKYLLCTVLQTLQYPMAGLQLFSFGTDELVYERDGDFTHKEMLYIQSESIEKFIKTGLGLDIRVEPVKITRLPVVNSHGNTVDAYVRTNIITGEEKLKKVSTTFYPQVYKLWKGIPIEERDKKFFFENQIATFDNQLQMC
jgi:hypothetical protein